MKILAIESSCDETSAAVIEERDNLPFAVSNIVSSQIDIHKKFGGVVPEVAARAHIEAIIPTIKEAFAEGKVELGNIDYIAVTYGPGLIGSLVVGVETAKALAVAKEIPLIPVNHLEGHLYANFLDTKNPPRFPIIALIVSGGHTMLVLMRDHLAFEIIGKTRDDAAGEAFDKAAKIMGLGYPGGPIISRLAEKGDEEAYQFPVIDLTPPPSRNSEGFLEYSELSMDFSFSGLKTALITRVRKIENLNDKQREDLAASFEKAIIDNLSQNVLRAIEKFSPKTFILSGGVAANKKLRETLRERISGVSKDTDYLIPDTSLCTDNAAMIGAAAFFHIKKSGQRSLDFSPEPNLELGSSPKIG